MLGWLVLAFVSLPVVELALLVWIGERIGLWPTVGIVLATGVLGAILARVQGLVALREVADAVRAGRVPKVELAAGALFLVGAAFLLTPGVITDVAGFLLMVPMVRRWTARFAIKRVRSSDRVTVVTHGVGWGSRTPGGLDGGETYEAEGYTKPREGLKDEDP